MASSSNSVLRMISCLRAAMEEENTEGEMIERRVDRKNKSTTNFFFKKKDIFPPLGGNAAEAPAKESGKIFRLALLGSKPLADLTFFLRGKGYTGALCRVPLRSADSCPN